MVREFHESFGAPVGRYPSLIEEDRFFLRRELISEEALEVLDAFDSKNLENITKELCDLLYVTYGTAVELGIDLDKAFESVHNSNMSKLGEDGKPVYREDGKVLKGPNYRPADLREFLQ